MITSTVVNRSWPFDDPSQAAASLPLRICRHGGNLLLALALAAMVLLPIADILLRGFFDRGITATPTLVQHLTLVVGMLGGALAARDQRLLALATAAWLRGRRAAQARWFSRTIAAIVCIFLTIAAVQFVLAEREGGQRFLDHVPLWVVQSVLPLGFAAIALWLLAQAGRRPLARLAALLTVAATVAFFLLNPFPAARLVFPVIAVLLLGTALGTPIFAALGGVGLVLFWGQDLPIAAMPVEHYRLTVNPALPSIPLFTLAGFFLAEGGAARRLVVACQALCGGWRGGPVVVVALVCAFFTAFTGASGVTILALATLLLPLARSAGLTDKNALGLLTGAGSLGVLLPPCLPVILYAIVARVDMKAMFLGGLVPGILLIVLTIAWGLYAARRNPAIAPSVAAVASPAPPLLPSLWAAKWELLLPAVALAALFGGWATPVETAALTAAGAFIIEFFIHRDLRLTTDGPRVAAEAGLLVGAVLLILGIALGFTNYIIDAQVPDQLADWAAAHVHSPWLFLLGLNLVLILIGSVVEIYAAIIVVTPLLVPIGMRLGLDPIHLGVLFLANLELGFLAPPLGLNLLLASSRLNRPVSEVTRAALPMLGVLFLGVLAITYFPPLTTALPRWFSTP